MTQDWAAVAATIDEHITRLGLDTSRLADRSGVSVSIVRELRHNAVQCRRDGRVLHALSIALELHPRHLSAVAAGHPPPAPDDPIGATDRLTRIEHLITDIADQVRAMNTTITAAIHAAQNRQTGPPG